MMKKQFYFIGLIALLFFTSCVKSASEKIEGTYTGTYSSSELGGAGTGSAKVISTGDRLINIEFKVNGYDPVYINDINITVAVDIGGTYTLDMENPAINANFSGSVVLGVLGITNDMLTMQYSSDNMGIQFNGYRN
ncbi:MAG: hypothetical protein IAE67_09330 [Candidatus Competibacteraceae bacterium]|nr:hypothetical protein [Candidatus Competibacteraceae bacterium]